ncbi:MAG: hypothetical protein DRO88_00985 [Promethearchaeia archaeon]|nr:MAG: hypothetical protein DRO88_00985 [Candidatus Lokiarchaeia archaeon]
MSLQIIKTFHYLKEQTIFHRLDPRTKGIMLVIYATIIFILDDLTLLLILTGLLIIALFLTKFAVHIWEGVKAMWFIYLLIFGINWYVTNLNYSLILILRFFNFMAIFGVFFRSTQPEDLSQSLIQLHVPNNFAFALSLAFRFIPTMAQETERVMEAQKSRGHQFNSGGLFQKARNFFPLLIPLIMNSVRRAFHVAEALETRGFGVLKRPTFYHELKWKKEDWIVVLSLLLLSSSVIALKICEKQQILTLPWQ